MQTSPTPVTRRQALSRVGKVAFAASGATLGFNALSQSRRSNDNEITLAQIVDVSQTEQDVSKDYLIGARAAWAEINLQGGLLGRKVIHKTLEVEGSPSSLRAVVAEVRDNSSILAIFGTAGHTTAQRVTQQLRQEKIAIAHAAPWLQVEVEASDAQTFAIFATRAEQIAFAVKNLTALNVREIGAVYASEVEHTLYKGEVERSASTMQLKVQHLQNGTDMAGLGQRLKLDSPAILLFLGGTPELAKFTQGLEQQARLRYCVAMADVNLQTLAQMGVARRTPVVVTQVVPMVNARMPVVRAYRDVLSRLFDEPPTPISLAGYLAARYTYEVIKTQRDEPTRQSILSAFQRSAGVDLGGFQVAGSLRRANKFVTQSMLSTDGRLIG